MKFRLKQRRADERGLTLVEVVVGLALLTFVSLTALPMMTFAVTESLKAASNIGVSAALQETIELMRENAVRDGCGALKAPAESERTTAKGKPYTIQVVVGSGDGQCTRGKVNPVEVKAVDAASKTMSKLETRIYIP